MKIKKLKEGAAAPKRATDGAAGYDLFIPEDTVVRPGRNIIPLGFAIEIPMGVVGKIESRSGFASKGMEDYEGNRRDADVIDGKIDPDYRGGVGVIINSHENYPFRLAAGTRVAQMIFYKYESFDIEVVDDLSSTDRGEGGFGSTGTK